MDGNYLPTDYQSFIHKSRYARWLDTEGRRESGMKQCPGNDQVCETNGMDTDTREELYDAIVSLQVMPSMRAMMTAGQHLQRDNTAGYNCSYLPVDDPKSFDEAMFILLVWYRCRVSC